MAKKVAAGVVLSPGDLKKLWMARIAVFMPVANRRGRRDGHAESDLCHGGREEIAKPTLTGYALIVTKSDLPVATNRHGQAGRVQGQPKAEFRCRVPTSEFLREGAAIDDFMPSRTCVVVGGRRIERAEASDEGYLTARCQLREFRSCLRVWKARVIKYLPMHFWRPRLLINGNLPRSCERTGADVKMVSKQAWGSYNRIGPSSCISGAGLMGGSCFPKDTQAWRPDGAGSFPCP